MDATLTRYRYVLLVALAVAFIVAVGYGLAHRPPPLVLTVLPPPPTPLPTATLTAAPLRCHVVGQVNAPGVYTLPPGARIQDALQAAGGPTADADLDAINLAAAVQDQQQIIVPRRPVASSRGTPTALVNINTADSATLQTLPGIGPVMADRIVAYRQEHGPFAALDDLLNVKGIGPATLDKLRPLITLGP